MTRWEYHFIQVTNAPFLHSGTVPDFVNELAAVNAGEKMHQRAGVKLHHGWMPNAPTGGLLLRDKQDEKCVASPANVPETSSVA